MLLLWIIIKKLIKYKKLNKFLYLLKKIMKYKKKVYRILKKFVMKVYSILGIKFTITIFM